MTVQRIIVVKRNVGVHKFVSKMLDKKQHAQQTTSLSLLRSVFLEQSTAQGLTVELAR